MNRNTSQSGRAGHSGRMLALLLLGIGTGCDRLPDPPSVAEPVVLNRQQVLLLHDDRLVRSREGLELV